MNWTGGRLKRHAKANANVIVRNQKQYFAKARLSLQDGQITPVPLTFFASFGGNHSQVKNFKDKVLRNQDSQHDTSPGRKTQLTSNELKKEHHIVRRPHQFENPSGGCGETKSRSLSSIVHQHDKLHELPGPAKLIRRSSNKAELEAYGRGSAVQHVSQQPATAATNSLEYVKRDLLNRSDWMSLSAARPLRINFAIADERDKIGKRRKVTREDRNRREVAQVEYTSQPPFHAHHRRDKERDHSSISGTEDPSIRIGDNIHQTQTTPLRSFRTRSTPNIPNRASSETMLLDKEDPYLASQANRSNSPEAKQRSIYSTSEATSPDLPKASLPTLDQVLDSETFDEVRARSASSLPKEAASAHCTSPRPTTSKGGKGTLIQGRVDSSSTVSCRDSVSSFHSQKTHTMHSYGSAVSRQNQRIFGDRNYLEQKPAAQSRSFGFSGHFREASRVSAIHGSIPSLSALAPSSSVSQTSTANQSSEKGRFMPLPPSRPFFTLDYQIELENVLSKKKNKEDVSSTAHENGNRDGIGRNSMPIRSRTTSGGSDEEPTSNLAEPRLHLRKPLSHRVFPTGIQQAASTNRVYDRGHKNPADIETQGTDVQADECLTRKLDQRVSHANSFGEGQEPNRKMLPTGQRGSHEGDITMRRPDDKSSEIRPREERRLYAKFLSAREFGVAGDVSQISRPPETHMSDRLRVDLPTWQEDRYREACSQERNAFSPSQSFRSSLAETVKTSANTRLNVVGQTVGSQLWATSPPSETDFLSLMSPMECNLDERLVNISVYNNAANTVRSFIPAPTISTGSMTGKPVGGDRSQPALKHLKRSAEVAFLDESSDIIPRKVEPPLRRPPLANALPSHRERLMFPSRSSQQRLYQPLWTTHGSSFPPMDPQRFVKTSSASRETFLPSQHLQLEQFENSIVGSPQWQRSNFPMNFTTSRRSSSRGTPKNGSLISSPSIIHPSFYQPQPESLCWSENISREASRALPPQGRYSLGTQFRTPLRQSMYQQEEGEWREEKEDEILSEVQRFTCRAQSSATSPILTSSSSDCTSYGPILHPPPPPPPPMNIHCASTLPLAFRRPGPTPLPQAQPQTVFETTTATAAAAAAAPAALLDGRKHRSGVGKFKMPSRRIFAADEIESVMGD